MSVKLYRCEDEDILRAVHTLCMPGDDWPGLSPRTAAWVGEDETGTLVAMCMARKTDSGKSVFLERAGVFRSHAGGGLQRRMIRARESWARRQGATHTITYTMYESWASITNLLRCGYRFYNPSWRWAGKQVHYFIREL